ncbi:MAG: M28 family peptidase [Tunicatimonas sp.]
MRTLAVSLLIATSGWAQTGTDSSSFDSTAYRYAQTIRVDDLRAHLSVLAADSLEGRETGQPGQKKAAEYLADYYRKQQLAPPVGDSSYRQTFPIVESAWDQPFMAIGGQRFTLFEDFYAFPAMAESLDTLIDEIAFMGYGITGERYDDYAQADVRGKVILILSGEPMGRDSTYLLSGTDAPSRFTTNFRAGLQAKYDMAQQRGARVVLVVDENYEANVRRFALYAAQPSMRLQSEKSQETSLVFISPAMAHALVGKRRLAKARRRITKKKGPYAFRRSTDLRFALQQDVDRMTSENVLGYLEGGDRKNELLVITSHYDHIGLTKDGRVNNGADDDGSGTVGVLELAEAFAQAKADGYGPRRSILFMNVSGEEKGLFGSEYYTDHPVFPLENTIADLNIDMIGRIDPAHAPDSAYVYVIGSNRLSTELHEINESANARYTKLELDYTYNAPDDPNRFYYRSDHYNFAKHGVPIIFYFNGTHADYHKPTDTIEKINFPLLRDRTRLVFYTAWQLANQDERIEVDVK